jgi:uncharacterized protein YodC (DUF2158 family)
MSRTSDTFAIRPGDTVRLKIGGPLMIVAGHDQGQCLCVWFDEESHPAHLRREALPPIVLELVPQD